MSDVLVLNFTYEAMNITSIARAIKLVYARKAEVVRDRGSLYTTSLAFKMPGVIRMLYYIRRVAAPVPLTKKNLLLRDDYRCQYCGIKGDRTLTIDHVLPRSRQGPNSWTNCVVACFDCNQKKKNRLPHEAGMALRKKPKAPSRIPWIRVKSNSTCPEDWLEFLWHDVAIDERT